MRAVNLLPSDLRGAPSKAPGSVTPAVKDSGGSGAFIALGALALCVLALVGYILTSNTIAQRESDLEAATARHALVTAEVNRLKPYADFQALASTRIATVRDLAGRRFDWERALRDLSRALPTDVSVKQLAGSVSGTSGGGNPLRGAINAPAIELSGCTSNQPAVARMMARLRGVSGVTRVSLANSTKTEGGEAGGTADSAAAGAPAEGCEGRGSDPADFSVVVFFENDAAAAADPAAAPAPTAAAPGAGTTAPGAAAAPGQQPAPTTEPASAGTSVPTSTEAK